jgi:hypothetical protein
MSQAIPSFFIAPMTSQENTITITLPKDAVKTLGRGNKNLFCSVVDGILQISGQRPNLVIPALRLSTDNFTSQK